MPLKKQLLFFSDRDVAFGTLAGERRNDLTVRSGQRWTQHVAVDPLDRKRMKPPEHVLAVPGDDVEVIQALRSLMLDFDSDGDFNHPWSTVRFPHRTIGHATIVSWLIYG